MNTGHGQVTLRRQTRPGEALRDGHDVSDTGGDRSFHRRRLRVGEGRSWSSSTASVTSRGSSSGTASTCGSSPMHLRG